MTTMNSTNELYFTFRGVESYQQSTTPSSATNNNSSSSAGGNSSYFEQTASTPSSASATPESGFNSFGMMPHETLVPSSLNNGSSSAATTSKPSANYGNFNSQFSNVIVGSSATSAAVQLLHQQQHQASRSRFVLILNVQSEVIDG